MKKTETTYWCDLCHNWIPANLKYNLTLNKSVTDTTSQLQKAECIKYIEHICEECLAEIDSALTKRMKNEII